MAPDVSLVIPAYNCPDLLEECLTSLEASEGVRWEATVVDNASPVDLRPVRGRHPGIRWLRLETNAGYAAANNLGLRGAAGRHFCWLNQDAVLEPDTLRLLVEKLDSDSGIGAATPVNVAQDGRAQPSCSPEHGLTMAWLRDSGFHLLFPDRRPFSDWLLPRFDSRRNQDVACTQTTCLLIRRSAYEAIGEMDERLFLFYNDVDYCRRLRAAGWRVHFLASARVLHHGSASVETAPWKEAQLWRDRYRYYRRWYGALGTLGVRCACLHRGVTRVLAQAAKGRLRRIIPLANFSWQLYRGLGSDRNGEL